MMKAAAGWYETTTFHHPPPRAATVAASHYRTLTKAAATVAAANCCARMCGTFRMVRGGLAIVRQHLLAVDFASDERNLVWAVWPLRSKLVECTVEKKKRWWLEVELVVLLLQRGCTPISS
ncbi:hypothetical protein Tco_1376094 [Tanacetum coccineum]